MSLGPLSITILIGMLAFQWRQVYSFWTLPILLGLVVLYFVMDPGQIVKKEERDKWDEGDTVEKLLNINMITLLLSGTIRRFGGGLTTGFLTI